MPRKERFQPSLSFREVIIDLITTLAFVVSSIILTVVTTNFPIPFLVRLVIYLTDAIALLKLIYTASRQGVSTVRMIANLIIAVIDSVHDIQQHSHRLSLPPGTLRQAQEKESQTPGNEFKQIEKDLRSLMGSVNDLAASLQNIQAVPQNSASQPETSLLLVKFIVEAKDSAPFSLDYLQLRVIESTDEKTIYTNEGQPILYRIQMIENRKEGTINYKCDSAVSHPNAYQFSLMLDALIVTSKPHVARLIDVNTGIPVFEITVNQGGNHELPDPELSNLIRDLAAIQLKVRKPIYLPAQDLSETEKKTIALLRTVLHGGIVEGEWETLSVPASPQRAAMILRNYEHSKAAFIEVPETETLFGTELPLGKVRVTFRQLELTNEQEIRDMLASPEPPTSMEFKFVPGSDTHMTKEYLDWLPPR